MKVKDHLFWTSGHSYKSTYTNPTVTTNEKPVIGTQKLERKEQMHTTKVNCQTTGTKRRTKNY